MLKSIIERAIRRVTSIVVVTAVGCKSTRAPISALGQLEESCQDLPRKWDQVWGIIDDTKRVYILNKDRRLTRCKSGVEWLRTSIRNGRGVARRSLRQPRMNARTAPVKW
jgi:hypothetical protein